MIKTFLKILITSILFLSAQLIHAEEINTFHSDLVINSDASIIVTETIEYNFEDNQKRGIFRNIPYTFNVIDMNNKDAVYQMDIELISVTRNGLEENYQLENKPGYFSVRIGNENIFISDLHTYEITYMVTGALRYFDDYDELYWNVTGNEWEVPINKASASISTSTIQFKNSACYAGEFGSVNTCERIKQGDTEIIFSENNLSIGEGLTVASSFDKGLVPNVQNRGGNQSMMFIFIFPFIFAFLLKIGIEIKKRKHFYNQPVVTEFEPLKNLNPIFTGYLMDTSFDPRDISAGIIYMAQQGYLTITHIPKENMFSAEDFLFDLNTDVYEQNEPLPKDMEFIISILFQEDTSSAVIPHRKLSDIRKKRGNKIYEKEEAKKYIVNELMEKNFLEKISFLGFSTHRLTKEGWNIHYYLKGFRRFLSMTEKERYAFFNNPTEMKGEEFMEYLPYAIAFGVEKKWALQFKHITIDDTSWYRGSSHESLLLANSLRNITHTVMSNTSTQSSGSGGGGSSGGGSGGGGGGSW